MKSVPLLNTAVKQFELAHQRYLSIESSRTECTRPAEREQMYIALMQAYLEVQYRAKVIAGIQYADGMEFADAN